MVIRINIGLDIYVYDGRCPNFPDCDLHTFNIIESDRVYIYICQRSPNNPGICILQILYNIFKIAPASNKKEDYW